SILVLLFFIATSTTYIYTLSLHDALPISSLNFSFRTCVARSTLAQRYSTCWMPSPNLARYFAMAPVPPGSRVVRMSRDIPGHSRSEEHTSELQSRSDLVCRLLLEKKNNKK